MNQVIRFSVKQLHLRPSREPLPIRGDKTDLDRPRLSRRHFQVETGSSSGDICFAVQEVPCSIPGISSQKVIGDLKDFLPETREKLLPFKGNKDQP